MQGKFGWGTISCCVRVKGFGAKFPLVRCQLHGSLFNVCSGGQEPNSRPSSWLAALLFTTTNMMPTRLNPSDRLISCWNHHKTKCWLGEITTKGEWGDGLVGGLGKSPPKVEWTTGLVGDGIGANAKDCQQCKKYECG